MNIKGNVVIAQGGGPTAVINQSLVGTILEARKFPQVNSIYGALNGVDGILNQNFIDLTRETSYNLERVATTPSSALLSTRTKPTDAYCRELFKILKLHNVRYFFYIGGNDSSDTLRILNDNADEEDYDFMAIHIPKTIDNDLVINDHTPGYGSAARYVSSAFMGINLDNIALKGIHIVVVMGRHAGFLTASSALARKYPDDGPHLIYMPERPLDMEELLKDVKTVYDKYGRCIIAMSEGVQNKSGEPFLADLVDELDRDEHGNVHLSGSGILADKIASIIKAKLNIKKVRADTLGYPQRNFIGAVSDVDSREAREVGEKAAHFAMLGDLDGSIVIDRTGNYSVNYRLVPLEMIAAKTRYLPDNFITEKGNDVTRDFIEYVKPLVGTNFPNPCRLRAPFVAKK